MSEPGDRTFVQLTEPVIGEAVLHIQEEGRDLRTYEVSREQLFALNAKSAEILMRGQGK